MALVCPYSLSRPGGVQEQVVGLAAALGRIGHRATVFAPLDEGTEVRPGIEVISTGRGVPVPANGSVAPVSLSVPAVVRSLRRLRAGGFDVVHVHEPYAPGLPHALLAARRLPPVVATFHRSGGSALYRALGPLVRFLSRRLVLCCAVSEAARLTAAEALGVDCEVCFNAVELGRYRGLEPWDEQRPAVLFLGRHESRKGLVILLEGFGRLRGEPRGRANDRPVLWIAGDGPETAALRHRFPEGEDIRWLGVLSDEEKRRRLLAARVLCAPSLGGESFGIVLLEAMAARTAVVASDLPGYREAVGGHATLVPAGDDHALAGGLEGALERDRHDGPELDEAFSWAARFSMEQLAEWYERCYEQVLASKADGRDRSIDGVSR